MGDLLGSLSYCWKGYWRASRGQSYLWLKSSVCPSAGMGTLCCRRCQLFRWDVTLISAKRGVPWCPGWIPKPGSFNLPRNLIPWLCCKKILLSVSTSANVCWVFCCKMAAVHHPGGGYTSVGVEASFSPHRCKHFQCLEKRHTNIMIHPSVQNGLVFEKTKPKQGLLFLHGSPYMDVYTFK